MTIPSVSTVGVDRLVLIPEYLNLGSVVIVAPDSPILRAWRQERALPSAKEQGHPPVVYMQGRRIVHEGASLPLSDREFRVLGGVLAQPGPGPSGRFAAWGGKTPASCRATPTRSKRRSPASRSRSRRSPAAGLRGVEYPGREHGGTRSKAGPDRLRPRMGIAARDERQGLSSESSDPECGVTTSGKTHPMGLVATRGAWAEPRTRRGNSG